MYLKTHVAIALVKAQSITAARMSEHVSIVCIVGNTQPVAMHYITQKCVAPGQADLHLGKQSGGRH